MRHVLRVHEQRHVVEQQILEIEGIRRVASRHCSIASATRSGSLPLKTLLIEKLVTP